MCGRAGDPEWAATARLDVARLNLDLQRPDIASVALRRVVEQLPADAPQHVDAQERLAEL